MHNYKELLVWEKARKIVKEIYLATQVFPDAEKFGLTSQMRRSAISIPSNIAEGSGRTTNKDFAYFLSVALSSAYELETQVILSGDLGFLKKDIEESLLKKLNEIQKMIYVFKRKMQAQ